MPPHPPTSVPEAQSNADPPYQIFIGTVNSADGLIAVHQFDDDRYRSPRG